MTLDAVDIALFLTGAVKIECTKTYTFHMVYWCSDPLYRRTLRRCILSSVDQSSRIFDPLPNVSTLQELVYDELTLRHSAYVACRQ